MTELEPVSDPQEQPARPAAARVPGRLATASRAWLYLVWLSLVRQAQIRQMVWIALALLGCSATIVGLMTAANRWGADFWEAFSRFSEGWVFGALLGFLVPIWSLSFATQALGGEREGRNLVWLLTRPMSRPAVYLAKFVALLPWSLGLTLGGFGLLCLLAGAHGRLAFQVYWPAILWATLAYCALFHLMGSCVRRPAVVAILYAFFLETFLGSFPGTMKRISISYYARCLLFDANKELGLKPLQKPTIFMPVDGQTAWWVLVGITTLLIVIGMLVFSWMEFGEEA